MLDTDKELMELFLLAYQRPDRMMNTKISISESAYSEFLFLLKVASHSHQSKKFKKENLSHCLCVLQEIASNCKSTISVKFSIINNLILYNLETFEKWNNACYQQQ